MQITFINKNSVGVKKKFIQLESADRQALVALEPLSSALVINEAKIVAYSDLLEKPAKLITDSVIHIYSHGEFEKDGIFVTALQSDRSASGLDLIEMEAEGVRVLFYLQDKPISKEALNTLGLIDVMILPVTLDSKDIIPLLSVIDPRVLLMTEMEAGAVEKFTELAGFTTNSTKKYKCRQIDFIAEEYILTGIELEAS